MNVPTIAGDLGLVSTAKWLPGPPGFPPGASFALLSGDPKTGPFVVRFRAPAGYRIPPHIHTDDEHVTVLSGTFHIFLGDGLTEEHVVEAGGYWRVPRDTPHAVWFSRDSVTQVHGSGPVNITYLDLVHQPLKP